MQRLKAEPNQKYGKYTAVKSENRCDGCAAEHDPHLCNEMPICSDSENSVIFRGGGVMNHIEEILKLEQLEKDIKLKYKEIYHDYAKKCQYKIGDLVKIKGYSYRGKTGKVTEITAKKTYLKSMPIAWIVKGLVLRVDGSIGSCLFEFDEWQQEKEN